MTPARCPIIIQSEQVLEESHHLARSIRRLRRSLRECQQCEGAGTCQFIQDFNAQFDAALQYVMDEWNLASTI